ncbi:MAG: hypothetical protein AABY05_00700 [Nanoarchaeota archaeon]
MELKLRFSDRKRGLSSVIATISLVLITLVALAIVAGVVIPLIKNNLSKTDCINYRDYFSFSDEFGYGCYAYSNSGELLNVFSIKANNIEPVLEENLEGFRLALIYQDSGESKTLDVNQKKQAVLSAEGIRMLNSSEIYLDVPKSGELRTYVYNSLTRNINRIEIYPKLKSGNVCEINDQITLEGSICDQTKIVEYN